MSLTSTVTSVKTSVSGARITTTTTEKIGDTLDQIFGGSSGAVDLSKLAPSILTTGGESGSAAVVDIYKGALNSPQNKITSILSGLMSGLEKFTGGLLNSKTLNTIQTAARTYDALKRTDWKEVGNGLKNQLLTGIVDKTSPIISQTLAKVGYTGESSAYIKGAMGLPGGIDLNSALKDNPKFKAVYDGVDYLVNKADYSSVDGMFKVLTNLSGNNSLSGLLNMESTFALLGVVTETAMLFDTPKLFEKIDAYFKRDDERKQYIIENIAVAAGEANLAFFEYSMNHVSRQNVVANYPMILEDLLSSFQFIDGNTATPEYAKRFINVCNWLRKGWSKTTWGNRTISNLELFTNMSPAATELLTLTDEYRDAIMIANAYPSNSLVSMLQTAYPRVPIRKTTSSATS